MNLEAKIFKLINYYYKNNKIDLYAYIQISTLFSFFTITYDKSKEATYNELYKAYSELAEFVIEQLSSDKFKHDDQLIIFIQAVKEQALKGVTIKNIELYQKITSAYLNILLKEAQIKEGLLTEFTYSNTREKEAIINLYEDIEPDELKPILDLFYKKIMDSSDKKR